MANIDVASFPTEILLLIFQHVDYISLKFGLSLTCRRFRNIILEHAHVSLARALFKDKSVTKGDTMAINNALVFEIHPAFRFVKLRLPSLEVLDSRRLDETHDIIQGRFLKNMGFFSSDGFVFIGDSPLAHEPARSPAVSRLVLNVEFRKGRDVYMYVLDGEEAEEEGECAVTLMDVLWYVGAHCCSWKEREHSSVDIRSGVNVFKTAEVLACTDADCGIWGDEGLRAMVRLEVDS